MHGRFVSLILHISDASSQRFSACSYKFPWSFYLIGKQWRVFPRLQRRIVAKISESVAAEKKSAIILILCTKFVLFPKKFNNYHQESLPLDLHFLMA